MRPAARLFRIFACMRGALYGVCDARQTLLYKGTWGAAVGGRRVAVYTTRCVQRTARAPFRTGRKPDRRNNKTANKRGVEKFFHGGSIRIVPLYVLSCLNLCNPYPKKRSTRK